MPRAHTGRGIGSIWDGHPEHRIPIYSCAREDDRTSREGPEGGEVQMGFQTSTVDLREFTHQQKVRVWVKRAETH